MSTKLWPVLSLSTLLLACAHNKANERAEERSEARAEAREERAEDREDGREDRREERAERREERDDRRAERGERDHDVDVPRNHKHRGQMASAGDELPAPREDGAHEPDNTGINARDRNGNNVTPMDQGNGEVDLDLTQRIRKAVMANDSLSFTAKNVKIISRDGQVVLRGPVKSSAEKDAIFKSATQEAGVGRVTNQLEVDQD